MPLEHGQHNGHSSFVNADVTNKGRIVMAQAPEPRDLRKEDLEAILQKAQGSPSFRDKVINSPEEVLKDANLGPRRRLCCRGTEGVQHELKAVS